jgi:aldehyde:ferredoxin oxidoreductase
LARGYMGRLLLVDLSKGKVEEEILEEGLCRRFIGGYGLGARLLYGRQEPGIDPLGPDNILGFFTGPLTGTVAVGGSRYVVVGKSPLTGGWGDANSGGDFGPFLKFAGFDGLLVSGIAEKPVYLLVQGERSEIRDAAALAGKDCCETEAALKSQLGRDVRVACIGPSGEKGSLIASVMNDGGRAAGRSGLGAVMGSKKLKAIAAVKGVEIPIADQARAEALRKSYVPRLGGTVRWLGEHGTAFVAASSAHSGDSPVRNWGGAGCHDFPDVEDFAAEKITGRRLRKYGCYRCPIACGAHMKAGRGDYDYEEGSHRPEYETLALFGSNCLNNNIESIIKVNDICNRYGIDTISAGSSIAFTIECYERGLLDRSDTDGIEMTWGNHRSIVDMTYKLARREGFGAILADGVKRAAERIGRGAHQYAMHIEGQELPAHDPKHDFHWGVAYLMDPTPARHTQNADVFRPLTKVVDTERMSYSGFDSQDRVGSMLHHVVNGSGMCAFVYSCLPSSDGLSEFLSAVTGWDLTPEELTRTGERILNIRQAFNVREGLNQAKFTIPGRLLGKPPLEEGPLAGVTIDEKKWFVEYFAANDWDLDTGRPSRRKLEELGLDDVAHELWP